MPDILATEITYQQPIAIFQQFADQPWAMLLHSANDNDAENYYSFIVIDPFLTLVSKNETTYLNNETLAGNPFQILQRLLNKYRLHFSPDYPPLQNGVVGYFSYDLHQHLERISNPALDDCHYADMMLGFYDLTIGFDHQQQRAWIFASGLPEEIGSKRKQRAQQRTKWLLEKITAPIPAISIAKQIIAPDQLISNFQKDQYLQAVQQVIDYIHAGDIFQANISQRFTATLPTHIWPYAIFCKLSGITRAPFSAYLHLPKTTIISASPERFIKLSHAHVETSPIKGTRPRHTNPIIDKALAIELTTSDKDRSENIMIVDLLRNDLSRVCQDHSIIVKELCQLKSFKTVHHLVSTITGKLKTDKTAIDLLMASFPGGSITGAPKIRAMEIIAEIEPTQRGPYCGCIGYLGFNGDMDTAITIRTYTIKDGKIAFQVGGGIVAGSDPTKEYEETLIKAKALMTTLFN